MYFHGIEMKGVLIVEKLDSLPSFSEDNDKGRLVYNTNENKLYIGKDTDWKEITLSEVLSDVSFSGDYNDLSNIPDFAEVATSGDYEDLSNRPNLSEVAVSNDYNDLLNTPDLSSVRNVYLSTEDPTDEEGEDNDIWIKYIN